METKDVILGLRNKSNLSQEELAEKVFVTRQAVSRWETGDSDPSAKNIISLCEIFSVSADFLLGKSGTPSIYIGSLCKEDQKKISAMVQVYINLSTTK